MASFTRKRILHQENRDRHSVEVFILLPLGVIMRGAFLRCRGRSGLISDLLPYLTVGPQPDTARHCKSPVTMTWGEVAESLNDRHRTDGVNLFPHGE
jgi:hypothetical protein